MKRVLGSALFGSILLVRTTCADVLLLEDGRIFEGLRMARSGNAVVIQFENGDVAVPGRLIRDCILEGNVVAMAAGGADEDRDARGRVRFEGKWVSPRKRDALVRRLIEDERAEVEARKQGRYWRNRRREDSRSFCFEYTAPEHLFEDYRDGMEAFVAEFAKRWKVKKPRGLGRLAVRVHVDPESFYQVTGVPPGVLAFFEWAEPPYRLQCYYDRLDPLGSERDAYHELGHYLQKLVDTDFFYSHWPGESLAEYWSTSAWDPERRKLTLGHDVLEERVVEIHADIADGDWVGLEQMIRGANDGNYHDYTWGWSFVHLLMGRAETRKRFERFHLALARGKDVQRILARDKDVQRISGSVLTSLRIKMVEGDEMLRVFRKYMKLGKDEDLRELESEWHRYVENELVVRSSRGLARGAALAVRAGRKHRARRLFQEAVDAGDADALTHHRFGELLADMGEREEAAGQWARAAELDPLVPEFYIAWGESLLKRDETRDEGRRLLRLAHEIEPDNLYLERNLERLLASRDQQDRYGARSDSRPEASSAPGAGPETDVSRETSQ